MRVSGSKVLGGCLVGRAPHQLADVFGTSRLRLGGRYAAFAVSGSDKTVQSFEIEVRDLANGRIVVNAPTGVLTDAEANPSAALGRTFTGIGPTTELVLSPNATIAWIARDIVRHPPPAQATYEVHLAGPHGMTRTLAAGPDIDPASLALASGIVYWTQAGSPKSANFS